MRNLAFTAAAQFIGITVALILFSPVSFAVSHIELQVDGASFIVGGIGALLGGQIAGAWRRQPPIVN